MTKNKYGVKIGDIFYYILSNDITKIYFFQVTGLKGTTMATLQQVEAETNPVDDHTYMAKPVPNSFLDNSKPFTRKISDCSGKPSCILRGYEEMELTDVNKVHFIQCY